jgi:hypothetical protein
MHDDRGYFGALIGDGRPPLKLVALCLVLSGLFALFLSAVGQFLPHDVQFLGMTAQQLCTINECRIVHFMFHDRVSFGGVLIAVGTLYLWLAEFPLRHGQAWAWWLFLVSGVLGFGSFLAYLGYGYLDTWHGVATLGLLPCFILGMVRAYYCLPRPVLIRPTIRPAAALAHLQSLGPGRLCLLATAVGLIGGGATILTVGVTCVFVPQDLTYMKLSADDLRAINPRLVPLIAHDRAGFGGGVLTYGVLLFVCVWCGWPSPGLWQALGLSGLAAFTTAIGVHPLIGYTDPVHLAPAAAGAGLFLFGMVLTFRQMMLKQDLSALAEEHEWRTTQAS